MNRPVASTPTILECTDSDVCWIDAKTLLGNISSRSIEVLSSRVVQLFIKQNKDVLSDFDVQVYHDFDGKTVSLVLRSGQKIGAVPLISPTSGKHSIGLVIRPRFQWSGIGAMLAQMGWRVVPTLVKLPPLPGTEKHIPPWVLSSVILVRIQKLIKQLDRRFEIVNSLTHAPKGTINWTSYATEQIPNSHFLEIPCQYPDLRDNTTILGVLHYTLQRQLVSLASQVSHSSVVNSLIDFCNHLLSLVRNVPPRKPTSSFYLRCYGDRYRNEIYRQGIQAIEWSVEDRGLAGISEIQGLPWVLPMDLFFEAWVETLSSQLVRKIGGTLKVGRRRETLVPIYWDKSMKSTQKYLLPDIIVEHDDVTLVVDAKYKRHWEEFQSSDWSDVDKEIQEQHREDMMQILAYSSLVATTRVIACIVYPCQPSTYASMREHNRQAFHATIPIYNRQIEVLLTAVPISEHMEEVTNDLASSIKYSLSRL